MKLSYLLLTLLSLCLSLSSITFYIVFFFLLTYQFLSYVSYCLLFNVWIFNRFPVSVGFDQHCLVCIAAFAFSLLSVACLSCMAIRRHSLFLSFSHDKNISFSAWTHIHTLFFFFLFSSLLLDYVALIATISFVSYFFLLLVFIFSISFYVFSLFLVSLLVFLCKLFRILLHYTYLDYCPFYA